MWPDHEDVARVLKTLPSPKPAVETVYQDAVLAHCLLFEAYGRCRNLGRHNFHPVSDIKKFAENFIGKTIDGTALLVAIRMNGFQVKPSGSDESVLLVKLPRLERFEEARELWNQRQAAEQKQIDEEVKRWAAFRTKHPARVLYGS
jgi:hypothetical protein